MEDAAFAATVLASTWLLAGVFWGIAVPNRRYRSEVPRFVGLVTVRRVAGAGAPCE
jgi:hypothetical protein